MKSILACLLPLALALASAAQKNRKQPETHPDLTGTWTLDKSKSSRSSKFDSTLVITHRDPELRITRTDVKKRERVTREYVFYLKTSSQRIAESCGNVNIIVRIMNLPNCRFFLIKSEEGFCGNLMPHGTQIRQTGGAEVLNCTPLEV